MRYSEPVREQPLHIVGAGGFGRETFDVAVALGLKVAAFADDALTGGMCRGLPVIAPDEVPVSGQTVVAIADPSVRRRLVERLIARDCSFPVLVHPRATIAPETVMGGGSTILAGAYVSSSVQIGEHVQVNYNATIGHDTSLDDYTTVLPGSHVSGSVHLHNGATVGANATILPGLSVGPDAFVGAGGVVVKNVPGDTTVVGVPAQPLRPRES